MSIIIDAGACIGEWLSDRLNNEDIFYCFEPLDANFLRLHVGYNDKPNVTLVQAALGSVSGIITLYNAPNAPSWGASTCPDKWKRPSKVDVPVVRLSDYWKEYINGPVKILKMNIEGAEYDVLEDLLDAGIINEFSTILYQDHGIRGDKCIPSCRDKAYEIFPRLQKEFTGELLFIPHCGTNCTTDKIPDYLK